MTSAAAPSEMELEFAGVTVPSFWKAGFRYGDMAPMAIIEFVDRDVDAKGAADKARVELEEAAEE